jgi:hypothetical protein
LKIHCIYCDKPLHIKAGDDPGKNDPNPENRGFFDNFYNGTVWDSCYVEKKDRSEMIDQYLNKYKKNYPKKKSVPELLEDDVGLSDTTKTAGVLKKTYAYYKCPHCKKSFFKNISSKERQKHAVGNPDPNAIDLNHLNNQDQFGTQPVDNVSSSTYKDKNDFNRGNSSIKTEEKYEKRKIKWKRK